MATQPTVPVFDGHNDTLTQIRNARPDSARSFLERSERGHIDLPRAREGGLGGGLFAIFTASPDWDRTIRPMIGPDGKEVPGGRAVELPPRLPRRKALLYALSVISDLLRLEAEAKGALEVVRTVAQLRGCLEERTFAAVLHIEGGRRSTPASRRWTSSTPPGSGRWGPCGAARTPSRTASPSTSPAARTPAPG